MTQDEKLFTVEEAAEWLRVNERTVRLWIRDGSLPAANLGKRAGYRIASSDLLTFFNERREAVKAEMQREGGDE